MIYLSFALNKQKLITYQFYAQTNKLFHFKQLLHFCSIYKWHWVAAFAR